MKYYSRDHVGSSNIFIDSFKVRPKEGTMLIIYKKIDNSKCFNKCVWLFLTNVCCEYSQHFNYK